MMSLVCGHNHAMYPIWRMTNDDALNWSLELDLSLGQFISDIRKVRIFTIKVLSHNVLKAIPDFSAFCNCLSELET